MVRRCTATHLGWGPQVLGHSQCFWRCMTSETSVWDQLIFVWTRTIPVAFRMSSGLRRTMREPRRNTSTMRSQRFGLNSALVTPFLWIRSVGIAEAKTVIPIAAELFLPCLLSARTLRRCPRSPPVIGCEISFDFVEPGHRHHDSVSWAFCINHHSNREGQEPPGRLSRDCDYQLGFIRSPLS